MTDFLKISIRIPLTRYQSKTVREDFPTLDNNDKHEYIRFLLGTDNVLIDSVEEVLEKEIVKTFCGELRGHAVHDIVDTLDGFKAIYRCPGL